MKKLLLVVRYCGGVIAFDLSAFAAKTDTETDCEAGWRCLDRGVSAMRINRGENEYRLRRGWRCLDRGVSAMRSWRRLRLQDSAVSLGSHEHEAPWASSCLAQRRQEGRGSGSPQRSPGSLWRSHHASHASFSFLRHSSHRYFPRRHGWCGWRRRPGSATDAALLNSGHRP